jgi:VanZ family protein
MTWPEHPIARWAPVVIWMGVIFWFSAQPSFPQFPNQALTLRKVAHVCEYAVLAMLLARAIAGGARPTLQALGGAIFVTVLYAISDEIHQGFVPPRMPSATDVVIDTVGGLLGLGAWYAWHHRRRDSVTSS